MVATLANSADDNYQNHFMQARHDRHRPVAVLAGDHQVFAARTSPLANQVVTGRNTRCPCGSTRTYQHCHLRLVEVMTRRVGLVRTREIGRALIDEVAIQQKMNDDVT